MKTPEPMPLSDLCAVALKNHFAGEKPVTRTLREGLIFVECKTDRKPGCWMRPGYQGPARKAVPNEMVVSHKKNRQVQADGIQ